MGTIKPLLCGPVVAGLLLAGLPTLAWTQMPCLTTSWVALMRGLARWRPLPLHPLSSQGRAWGALLWGLGGGPGLRWVGGGW